jgi:hypothetical protein
MEPNDMNAPQEQQANEAGQRTPKSPIDPALARRNRRTAGLLILLALGFLVAFLNNFGVFK